MPRRHLVARKIVLRPGTEIDGVVGAAVRQGFADDMEPAIELSVATDDPRLREAGKRPLRIGIVRIAMEVSIDRHEPISPITYRDGPTIEP